MPRKSRQHKNNTIPPDEQWQQAWNNPIEMDASKKRALLNKVHQRMDDGRRKKKRWMIIGISAAAAVLAAVFIKMPANNDIHANVNQWQQLASGNRTQKLLLTDGSVVWLAPNSAIRIYTDFLHHRSTTLEKGTAFFSVAKDASHPFTIAVNRQQVTVVGTAFAVRRYDSIDLLLTVKEGKVALNNPGGQRLVTAGEQVRTTGAITGGTQIINPAAADWWLQQQVRLQNISLEELLNLIETYYEVHLSHGVINKKMKVSLTWDMTISLKENLRVLNSLTGYHIH